MILFSWAIVTTRESSDTSPMLVSPCELDVPGVVIMAYFSDILLAIFYYNLGSECIIKPYRGTTVDFLMG